MLASLPAGLPAAVFVVVHTSPSAPALLGSVLARVSRLPVRNAIDGEPIAVECDRGGLARRDRAATRIGAQIVAAIQQRRPSVPIPDALRLEAAPGVRLGAQSVRLNDQLGERAALT